MIHTHIRIHCASRVGGRPPRRLPNVAKRMQAVLYVCVFELIASFEYLTACRVWQVPRRVPHPGNFLAHSPKT